jgi:NAD-dependent DNA ligase
LGGEVSESINRMTAYLVAGVAPGSKLTKAHDLNNPILEKEAF